MHDDEVEDVNERLSRVVEHHVKLQVRQILLAVRSTGRRISQMLWGGVTVICLLTAFGAYVIDRNRQAIRVSCLLLSEKLIESGGSRPPKGYKPTPAAMAQAEITARLLLRIDQRVLTPGDRAYIAERQAIIDGVGGPLVPPDCDDVARHPGKIEDQLKRQK